MLCAILDDQRSPMSASFERSADHTGSNSDISQRPPISSNVTFTTEAVFVGASLPATMV
jgi:hypothetical protein